MASRKTRFRILQATDLHFMDIPKAFHENCKKPHTPEFWQKHMGDTETCTRKNLELLEKAICKNSPDIVVFTGDIIDGRGSTGIEDFCAWARKIDDLLSSLNVPWVYIPGNHEEDDNAVTRSDILKAFKQFPSCIVPECDDFYYTLPWPPVDPRIALLFFDAPQAKAPYSLDPNRVNHVFTDLKKFPSVGAALGFVHEPLPSFTGDIVAAGYSANSKDDRFDDGGLLKKSMESGKVIGVFCGHDHHRDCVYHLVHGADHHVLLGFGRCGSFFPPSEHEGDKPLPFKRGCRMFELDTGRAWSLQTWIFDESGDSVDKVQIPLPAKSARRTQKSRVAGVKRPAKITKVAMKIQKKPSRR
eukprot:TRINITY_DN79089_c0_g1_i1.p1 TRINITY_DN79089_c0_g1~~TRINITY_DN79089_c0_g1_i1.p1  ORF type:complete len:357 (-),score=39.53 TRINITY_DN79089_c0_g1_i1:239-1309(-)